MSEFILMECGHCGNTTRHHELLSHEAPRLLDEVEVDEVLAHPSNQSNTELQRKLATKKLYATYVYAAYECSTCHGLSLLGDFDLEDYRKPNRERLYPRDSSLLPESHKLSVADPIPTRISHIYKEVYPLRMRSPNAFVVQIRRALEYICHDQNATGKDLFHKLEHLVSTGVFPGYFEEMTDLLRRVGNIGAHADTNDADIWDAELIDDFFRSVVEYVYVAPSKIERLKERLAVRDRT